MSTLKAITLCCPYWEVDYGFLLVIEESSFPAWKAFFSKHLKARWTAEEVIEHDILWEKGLMTIYIDRAGESFVKRISTIRNIPILKKAFYDGLTLKESWWKSLLRNLPYSRNVHSENERYPDCL